MGFQQQMYARGHNKETAHMSAPILGVRILLCIRERKYPEASGGVQSREEENAAAWTQLVLGRGREQWRQGERARERVREGERESE